MKRRAVEETEVCRQLDQWPGYETCEMSLPGWMKRNEEG